MGLEAVATSMAISTGGVHDPNEVTGKLLEAFSAVWRDCAVGGLSYLCESWRENDWLSGRELSVRLPGGEFRGRYDGIDNEGCLVLTDKAGKRHTVLTGDVSHINTGDGSIT